MGKKKHIGRKKRLFVRFFEAVENLTRGPSALVAMVKILIKPRVEKDKWSLYWKCSMSVKTEIMDELELELPLTATVAAMKAMIAKEFQWEPVNMLLRLDGFEEPWELAMYKGIEMPDECSLEECGIMGPCEIITKRKVLVAEGWKMCGGGDDDSSTDEDDF